MMPDAMAQAIINGRVHIIYENTPSDLNQTVAFLKADIHRQEKLSRERDWKRWAIAGYWAKR